jgi:hypothetical protein
MREIWVAKTAQNFSIEQHYISSYLLMVENGIHLPLPSANHTELSALFAWLS